MTRERQAEDLLELWLKDPVIDQETKDELCSIAQDPKEVMDRFHKDLEFGTGGLRGLMGAGSNRINRYTVGKATQGLAQYLLQLENSPSAVIAYDSRRHSAEFALEAALVLAGNGIRTKLFKEMRPTPELSFAVRYLQTTAGIVITASHNPAPYNGYKVYGREGGQLLPEAAAQVLSWIRQIHSFADIQKMTRKEAEENQWLEWIGDEVDEAYLEAVTSVSVQPEGTRPIKQRLGIVYTPLHGSGNLPVRQVLQRTGFERVYVVKEQEESDPLFSTVETPNPEDPKVLAKAIRLAEQMEADLVIGTDPDADRIGVAISDGKGGYTPLTGNQTGVLIFHYLLSTMKKRGTLPPKGAMVKTVVTGEMGARIAQIYGVEVFNTLTGFKYIGQKIEEFRRSGDYQFIFGYEESCGYLAGTHAREKDAVVTAMLLSEAAAEYQSQGKSLYVVLEELYQTYGYFAEGMQTRTLQGMEGARKIQEIMADWRQNPPQRIAGVPLLGMEDFAQGLYGLPKENMLKFHLPEGAWICLRPSGTEPKIKIYFATIGSSALEASQQLQQLIQGVGRRIDEYLRGC
ncbi:phosphoglucomutase [Kroppenstedtia sanguinis]|uniref:phospho-sugar mutase n=1 Tax=Kroppenstedtia sanguinis TaxID=1380684 RepID=UPI003D1B70B8